MITSSFKFTTFSQKQLKVLCWWVNKSPVNGKNGIICDGAIRSGKTVVMSLSFVLWAMTTYNNQNFAMCGKTIGSFRRNVLTQLKQRLLARGYKINDKRAENLLVVTKGGTTNYFYIFGGKDESSQDLIQGVTLAGVLFDEVALMPRSFVEQATARCSVDGSKFWFNCNPEGPFHWFKTEWIDKADEKNMLCLHFTMEDNLSLSKEIKNRYSSQYSGVFFDRYILGLWKIAEGAIYDMFNEKKHIVETVELQNGSRYISCDYGTQNPTVFLMWEKRIDNCWICIKEYYYSGREERMQKTDGQYANDLEQFIGNQKIVSVIVDPSASSFIAELRARGISVIPANNEVLNGIRHVGDLLRQEKLLFCRCCENTIMEFSSYVWDTKAQERGEDKPIKENDHAMDAVRYFVNTVILTTIKAKSRPRGW